MIIVEKNWNIGVMAHLEPACNDSYSINDLAYDVQSGECSLFHVYELNIHIASMVLRLEDTEHNNELVVVALGGGGAKGALVQSIISFWDELAKNNGATTIRAHVSSPAMARLMERAGGVLCEYVYKREVV